MSALERELVALGAALDAPAGDALATSVRAAIVSAPAPRRRRRWAIVAAALLVAAGGAYSSVPAIAEWFGVKGVEIRLETPPTTAPSGPLDLGRSVTLEEARSLAGFELRVPASLGEPEFVSVDDSSGTRVVWMIFGNYREFHAVLMQADVRFADDLLATKFAEPGLVVERVVVGDHDGWWLQGAHTVAFYDRTGDLVVDRVRASENVLLWERDGVTFRLESPRSRAESIRIAESVE